MVAFEIGVREGILDPRHVRAIGPALWLFLWYVRRQTRTAARAQAREGEGWVNGGAPLRWEVIEKQLGVQRRTLQRWQARLKGENPEEIAYVEEHPCQRGFRVRLTKQRKFKGPGDES